MPLRSAGSRLPLLLLVTLYAVLAASRMSIEAFGHWHDDTILFASAKAMAGGEGFRLPSFPGEMWQTKYPPAYPLLASAAWWIGPPFPSNVWVVYGLNLIFGALFVVGCRKWFDQIDLHPKLAWVFTAMCAAHPSLIELTGSTLSDVAFLAAAIWSCVLAEEALTMEDSRRQRTVWIAATLLVTAAVLFRSVGLAVTLGLGLRSLFSPMRFRERAWLALPFAAFGAWTLWANAHQPDYAPLAQSAAGYRQTATFYASYARFWIESVPDLNALGSTALTNSIFLLREPATMALRIPGLDGPPGLSAASCIVSALLYIALIRGRRLTALHAAVPPYFAVVLLWNYPLTWRFLLPFLPMFLGVIPTAVGPFYRVVRRALASGGAAERALAVAYCLAGAAIAALSLWGYLAHYPAFWAEMHVQRQELSPRKENAYQWIRDHTRPEDRIIAYEDALLYLHTGRQALRPLAVTTDAIYSSNADALDRQMLRMEDAANEIGARYWITSPDDFGVESGKAADPMLDRQDEIVAGYELVFEDGGVRIYRR